MRIDQEAARAEKLICKACDGAGRKIVGQQPNGLPVGKQCVVCQGSGLAMARAWRPWLVPFTYKGREIDAAWIQARSKSEAKRLAKPIFTERGYTKEGHYAIGTPFVPGDE